MVGTFEVVNNLDFYREVLFLDFLREYGKHFRVTSMLRRESVQRRLESEAGLSFLEFAYSALQAYDFWVLFREKRCLLQIGGSDQLGNIQSGTELIGKLLAAGGWAPREGAHGATTQLLLNESGEKFGKSENEVVWVDPESDASLLALHQFLVNQSDSCLQRLFAALTFVPMAEVEELLSAHAQAPDQKTAQFELSRTVLEQLTNDPVRAEKVLRYREYFDLDFEALRKKHPSELEELFARFLNVFEEPAGALECRNLLDVLHGSGVGRFSRSELRTLVKQGAVRVNGVPVGLDFRFSGDLALAGDFFVVKLSKKNFFILRKTA